MAGDSVIDFVYGAAALALAYFGGWGLILILQMMSGEMIKVIGGAIIIFPVAVLIGHGIRANKRGR